MYKKSRNLTSGVSALTQELINLPLLYPPGTSKQRFSSSDATGGNGREFLTWFTKYIDNNGEYVFFDAMGPGCLYRQHMNIWRGIATGADADKVRIRYYFDNEPKPKIDCKITDFFNSETEPFSDPFGFTYEDMFGIQYYPFSFKTRLKVTIYLEDPDIVKQRDNDVIRDTLEGPAEFGPMRLLRNWHQYDYLSMPVDTQIESWQPGSEDSKQVITQWRSLGKDLREYDAELCSTDGLVVKKDSMTSLLYLDRAGCIMSMKLHIEAYNADICDNLMLRFRWDDLDTASFEIPFGFFFGGGNSIDGVWNKKLANILYGFNGDPGQFYCYWPMPFWKKARIDVINRTQTDVVFTKVEFSTILASDFHYNREKCGYFMTRITKNAVKNEQTGKSTNLKDAEVGREVRKKPYATAFEENGRGHVVGINMWSSGYQVDGSEYTFIDGIRSAIRGTGTEDDFNQGFDGDKMQKPLWGTLVNGAHGVYRLHLNAPYIFYKSIKIHFNYSLYQCLFPPRKGLKPEDIHTEFLVYYYKAPQARSLVLTDELDICNPASEQQHEYRNEGVVAQPEYKDHYDRYWLAASSELIRDCGVVYTGSSSFRVRVSKDNQGIKIRRRLYRKGQGVQTSDVYIDGVLVPRPWHIVTNSGPETYQRSTREECRTFDGWYDSDFEVPAAYTAGKSMVEIKMVPKSETSVNEFYYWVYSY